ncbi:hypothetical protein CDAR_459971 [Caerostris darwini]|uniref:Uncharacterized protein n=1 Tax=Caerostris darwini TaxID=1538125 RepID=A0AAV4QNG9_9ARAC|nr:hypothetical protein CDAR_459971 [Caerostris darwini]
MTAPINFGKLLPGSTFIRELVPFCPCSVYPGPKWSHFMESSGNPLSLIRSGQVPPQRWPIKYNLLNYKRGGYCHGPHHDVYWNGVRYKEKTLSCLVHGSSR